MQLTHDNSMSIELKRALTSILIGTLTALFAAIIQALTQYLQTFPTEIAAGMVASLKYLKYYV